MNDFIYYVKYPNGKIFQVPYNNVVNELYWNLGVIPSLEELKKYNCDKNYIITFKKNISEFEEIIPMFDINTKNIYPITFQNLQLRVNKFNYRVPNNSILELLKETLEKYSNKPSNKFNETYIEKLIKNINFLECYDLSILQNTYYKMYYKSIENNNNLTNCIRPSYFSFMKNITLSPYYFLDEMKMTLLNTGYKLEDIQNMSENDMCKIISKNEIPSKLLLYNHIYIKENYGIPYVQLYTLIG